MQNRSFCLFLRLLPWLVVLLLFSYSLQGQNRPKADSLLQVIAQAAPDTNKVWLLFDLGEL